MKKDTECEGCRTDGGSSIAERVVHLCDRCAYVARSGVLSGSVKAEAAIFEYQTERDAESLAQAREDLAEIERLLGFTSARNVGVIRALKAEHGKLLEHISIIERISAARAAGAR